MKRTIRTMNVVIALAICATLFNGCTKDGAPGLNGNNGATGATGVTGPAGPVSSGNLYGYARLYDQDGSQILSGVKNIKVTLIGDSTKVTYPDSTGKYSFLNIPYGNYNLYFSDTLFGSTEINNVPFTGGDYWVKNTTNLSKIPDYYVNSLTTTTASTYLNITGSLDTNGQNANRAMILFIGNTNAVSSNPNTFLTYYSTNVNTFAAGTYTIQIPITDIVDAGFTAGQTIYFAAYGISVGYSTSSIYQDLATGRIVVTGINPQVFTSSYIMP
jgi:hypothetical protein